MCLEDTSIKNLGFAITIVLAIASLIGVFIIGYSFSIVDVKFDDNNWNYLAVILMVFIVFIFLTYLFGIISFCLMNKVLSCIV